MQCIQHQITPCQQAVSQRKQMLLDTRLGCFTCTSDFQNTAAVPSIRAQPSFQKSTRITSTALQNTMVSVLPADVATVLLMEVNLCLHSKLGHFLFTTKMKDLSLIIGYD